MSTVKSQIEQETVFTCQSPQPCTLGESIEALVEEFEGLEAWDERYQVIIEMGDDLLEMPQAFKTPEYQVDGCMSTVWLVARWSDDDEAVVQLLADSDSQIVKGLVSILLRVYNGRPAEEILSCDIECIFDRLNLRKHLSSQRKNGLHAMIKKIRGIAAEHVAAQSA